MTALLEYQVLRLVPRSALLIKRYGDSALFKSIRLQDATPTSFSAYGDYGIGLSMRDNYYTLPKRELSIREVFIHSLDSAGEFSQKLFCILFYLKNKDKLVNIDHPMMKDLKAVLQGERLRGNPTLEDIEDRTDLYDIFVMKLIANRQGDAPDCSNLIIAELDFDAVFREIEAQYRKAGELEQKIWITYIEEGIGRLEDEFSAIVPIGDRISALADEYRERLYQNLKPG